MELVLFNSMGQKVKTIMKGKVTSGIQDVLFEKGNLPAGNYYYQLSYQAHRVTKSMVIQ